MGMDANLFNEGHLLGLEDDNIKKDEYSEDVELEGIEAATWAKKNELWVVLQEHRLELLPQYHDSQVAAY